MRTVTFSDPAVAKLLNDSFVCVWTNKRPAVRFKDGLYAGKETKALPNGTAPDNVTSVFAAWDGTVIHVRQGSLDGPGFLEQIRFAKDLHDQIYEGVGRRADAEEIFRKVHRAAAAKATDYGAQSVHYRLSKELSNIRQWYPSLFEMLFERECKD